jgi:hypothetical protein
MTPIGPFGLSPAAARPPVARARAVGGGFTVPAEPTGSEAVARATELSGVASGPFGQDCGEDAADEPARRHGAVLLGQLADLQMALLSGVSTRGVLATLRERLERAPRGSDPRLIPALAAIMLRVRVELARHEPET